MGVPVIVTRQTSLEFLERYNCGVLVEDEKEFIDAVDAIQSRLPEMKANAKTCAKKYIYAPGQYKVLVKKWVRYEEKIALGS